MKIKVRLTGGSNKIAAIKTIKVMTDLGLKESKDLMDALYGVFEGQDFIMTDTQLGRMIALAHTSADIGFSYGVVSIVTDSRMVDVTGG